MKLSFADILRQINIWHKYKFFLYYVVTSFKFILSTSKESLIFTSGYMQFKDVFKIAFNLITFLDWGTLGFKTMG